MTPDQDTAPEDPARLRPDFRRRLDEAAAFKDAHGRLPRSGGHAGVREISLARWIHRQRTRLSRGLLPENERTAIEAALGPWTKTPPARPRREWTPDEEELAAHEDLTVDDVVRLTGRTLDAVLGKRHQLRYARRPIR